MREPSVFGRNPTKPEARSVNQENVFMTPSQHSASMDSFTSTT